MLKTKFLLPGLQALLASVLILSIGCTPTEYKVETEANPGEAGEVTGAGIYQEGKEVKVEAEAYEGYCFSGWQEDGKTVEIDPTYEFKLEKDRHLTAVFEKETALKIETETIGDYQVKIIKVEEDYLQSEGEVIELPEDSRFELLLVDLEDYLITAHPVDKEERYGEKTLKVWSADNQELIEELVTGPTDQPEIKAIANNHFAYEDGSITHLARIKQEGIEKITTFDLKDLDWDLEMAAGYGFDEDFFPGDDWKEAWESFEKVGPMAGPGVISIQVSEINDYLFVYPDFSKIFHAFEVPPNLKEPFFKVFRINDGELELVEDEIFQEPIYSTDVTPYLDNQALVACGEKGFILLDLDDFSYEILEAGGNYLEEEHRVTLVESGLHRMNAHHFYNITPGGAVLAKTWLPSPVCSESDPIHLWAPANGDLKLLAESTAGMGADGPFFFEKGWWLKGRDLLILNEEKIQAALEKAPLEDLPEVISYFDSDQRKAEVSSILDQVLDREAENGPIFLWQALNGKELVKLQRGGSEDSGPGIVKTCSGNVDILLVKETSLEIPGMMIPEPVHGRKNALDHENERVYFASGEKIYILDFEVLFDPGSAED